MIVAAASLLGRLRWLGRRRRRPATVEEQIARQACKVGDSFQWDELEPPQVLSQPERQHTCVLRQRLGRRYEAETWAWHGTKAYARRAAVGISSSPLRVDHREHEAGVVP